MKNNYEEVVVEKNIRKSTRKDYHPVTFTIEIGDRSRICGFSEESAKYIYEKLGEFLNEKGGKQ